MKLKVCYSESVKYEEAECCFYFDVKIPGGHWIGKNDFNAEGEIKILDEKYVPDEDC